MARLVEERITSTLCFGEVFLWFGTHNSSEEEKVIFTSSLPEGSQGGMDLRVNLQLLRFGVLP
jgi:hypothetical protein